MALADSDSPDDERCGIRRFSSPPSWGITGEFWTAIKISIPQVLVIVVWWKLMSEVLWQPLSNWAISKIRQGVWWTEAIPYVPVLLVICYSFFAR